MINTSILHYTIIEKLGEGGMGVVYKAHDTKLNRTVALKFLPSNFAKNETDKKRFLQEAKAAAALNHPNVCVIHDILEYDGHHFIVMEYIEGITLLEFIIEKEQLEVDNAIDITLQIAEVLREAHNKGIIHRDVKTSNIIITNRNEVKILDFGLAKFTGQAHLTKDNSTLGTVVYMSPEQVSGQEVDQRTDIWSLGVVLYEMLTGQLPFKGDYDQAIIYSILNEVPSSISDVHEKMPVEMEKIVNKCLMRQSTDRYQIADDLIFDLSLIKEQSILKTTQTKFVVSGTKKVSRFFIPSLVVIILIIAAILYSVLFNNAEEKTTHIERKMLVVLPFKNLGLQEDEYFADGITEEITSRLAEIKQLGVIGRTSADLYKNTKKSIVQIGEELGVDYLLEGSVRWDKLSEEESRIRVTPQLIKVSDGTHVWTKRYDAILESVFELQSDIAEKVAKALDITLIGTEQKSISQKPTENIEAYDYYLRGNYYHSQRGITEENFGIAEKMFLKAIVLDSNFVLPYQKLAQINFTYYSYHWDRNENRLSKAKYYIDKAKEINRDIPELYVITGRYYYHGFLDYDKALAEFNNGLNKYPNNSELLEWIGYIKRRQGKFEEAINYLEKAVKLNPRSQLNDEIGDTYLLLKKYESAEKYVDIAISNIPEWGYPYYLKAKIQIFRNGDINRANQILNGSFDIVNQGKKWITYLLVQTRILNEKYEEALKLISDESENLFEYEFSFEPKSQLLATIYRLQNKNDLAKDYYDSAKVIIETKLTTHPKDARVHSALGIVLAGLGNKDEAIKEGKRGTELLPLTREAWGGFMRELDLAKIYTMVGEFDLAIDKLEYLLSIPGELSVPYIKLNPIWRPLLDIPRFQKILNENK